MSDAAPGFAPLERPGPFLEILGPLYTPTDPAIRNVVATRVLRKHLNLRGIAHGGMLASLADTAFGITLWRSRDEKLASVTVNLNVDYLEPAREGDWVEAHVNILRIGKRLAFADGLLKVGDRTVLRANGTFAVVRPVA